MPTFSQSLFTFKVAIDPRSDLVSILNPTEIYTVNAKEKLE